MKETNLNTGGDPGVAENAGAAAFNSYSIESEVADRTKEILLQDPFDPKALSVNRSSLDVAKKLLTTVPVRKPNKQEFVRTCDEKMVASVGVLELIEDRETYLVVPSLVPSLEAEVRFCNLYLTMNRQGVAFFWPVKLGTASGKQLAWHTSAAEAACRAHLTWIRVTANQSLGAYEITEATAKFPEPTWPEHDLKELLRIAFKDHLIDNLAHPVLKQLRGEV